MGYIRQLSDLTSQNSGTQLTLFWLTFELKMKSIKFQIFGWSDR